MLDNGDGFCDATCTIRDAVQAANADTAPDTIMFTAGLNGAIVLETGQLLIQSSMSIEGPGLDRVSISGDANGNDIPDAGDSGVIYIDPGVVGPAYAPVSVSGLTLTEGNYGFGGAVFASRAVLTLDEVAISDSQASYGGGVWANRSDVTITDSVIRDNVTTDYGGGLYFNGGVSLNSLVIKDTTVAGNAAGGYGGGAWVENRVDSVLVTGSTFSGNRAEGGGGIGFEGGEASPEVLRNTTISGNIAIDDGGGLYLVDSYDLGIRLENSTVVDNVAGADGTGEGGGISRSAGSLGTTVLSSTIVANNTAVGAPSDLRDEVAGVPPVQTAFSLVEAPGAVPLVQNPAGPTLLGVDPGLAPLADNGGPTRTHLPTPASPLIDAGISNALTTDQRGISRSQQQPAADAAGSDGTDMGSVELVDTTVDGATVRIKKKQRQPRNGKKISVGGEAEAAEDVQVVFSGSVKSGSGKRIPLRQATAAAAADDAVALSLVPKKKRAGRRVAKRVQKGKRAKAFITVLFTDSAGNTATRQARVKLKAARKRK